MAPNTKKAAPKGLQKKLTIRAQGRFSFVLLDAVIAEVYKQVKKDIDSAARNHARLAMPFSTIGQSGQA